MASSSQKFLPKETLPFSMASPESNVADIADIVVPYIVINLEDDKHKAVFGVPSDSASQLIKYDVCCCGGCFSLAVEETSEGETTFLAATFDSIDAEKTAEAISHRLAVRLGEPTLNAESILGVGAS